MAQSRNNGRKKIGIVKLKVVVEKLTKSLSLSKRHPASTDFQESDELIHDSKSVPEDVKEGHFVVLVIDDGKPKRFVVALSYLNHPAFLRLLEQAAEGFGFAQEGALTIPCRSSELEGILARQSKEDRDGGNGGGSNISCKNMA
ncbi:hypothetical protein GIB67_000256 [Kingdonia uniflora]|uniref:SAUR family protein n=1 Tax=Kingdonia uniflora TaxID=39325 RepID=A0A7J7LC90_9MAGN|nr:hypothetical protein GIB67_000256 [Kingdonia uniflora]